MENGELATWKNIKLDPLTNIIYQNKFSVDWLNVKRKCTIMKYLWAFNWSQDNNDSKY